MTTVILAQKLMNTKLGKCEFEKVKWMRYCNESKKTKITQKLKEIIDDQMSHKTCRICLKPGGEAIFNSTEADLADNIMRILGVQISKGDGKPQHICLPCKVTVLKAAKLRQSTEIIQWRLQQEKEMVDESSLEVEVPCAASRTHGGYFVETKTKVLREWFCSKCRKVFDKRELFEEHEKLERCGRDKSFVCETCGKKFVNNNRMQRHRKIHSTDLPFSCPHCSYRARTKFDLNQHIRAEHASGRSKSCPYCPATFRTSKNLAAHKKMHFPPALHCPVCQRGFRFRQALRNHMGTQHNTEKPFSCETCGKTFSIRKMMRMHELKVHNRPKIRPGTIPGYEPPEETQV